MSRQSSWRLIRHTAAPHAGTIPKEPAQRIDCTSLAAAYRAEGKALQYGGTVAILEFGGLGTPGAFSVWSWRASFSA
jgi:hypothetical protein